LDLWIAARGAVGVWGPGIRDSDLRFRVPGFDAAVPEPSFLLSPFSFILSGVPEELSGPAPAGPWRSGRRFSGAALTQVQGWQAGPPEGATWRGWVIGLLAVVALCAALVLLFGMMTGCCGILRRQWSERERLAFPLALAVSFWSFLYTAYTHPGGAAQMSWYFQEAHARAEYGRMADTVQKSESFAERRARARQSGASIPLSEVPDTAKHDWARIFWLLFGGSVMTIALALRNFVFWLPHPIGYVMWTSPYTLRHTWFSFLLGWAMKAAILKYGGARAYLRARRFFIGVVVGEALAIIFWKAMQWLTQTDGAHPMLPT